MVLWQNTIMDKFGWFCGFRLFSKNEKGEQNYKLNKLTLFEENSQDIKKKKFIY